MAYGDRKNYCDRRTHELAFAPIHYASYNGDVDIIECLIAKGADISITNAYGLNVLHMAAQGD